MAMYNSHWKLEQRPFDNSLRTAAYYPSQLHQAAMAKLRYAIENRQSAAVLSGPSGTGKSLLLHRLIDQLPEFVAPVIRLDFTCLDAAQLVHYLAGRCRTLTAESVQEHSGDEAGSASIADSLAAIERMLSWAAKSDRQPVVVIDESHLLRPESHIETLRQLLNLSAARSNGEAAWTLVLCGMPSLVPQLQRNGAFADRVGVQCMLQNFTLHDTSAYVAHRLRVAGVERQEIFASDAIDLVHSLTDGIPRRINSLCDLALMVGYAQEATRIDASLIESIHAEMHPGSLVC